MRYRRLLTAGLITLGSLGFAAQGGVTLQRTLIENSTDTYKITAKIDQNLDSPQLGKQPLTVVSDMTYKLQTNKVDATKGSADVEATTSVDKVDFGDSLIGQMIGNKAPAPVVQDGTIDKLGHLVLKSTGGGDAAAQAVMGAAGGMQTGMFVELPDHAVKVGDSWDIVVPKGPYTGDTDQKITAKLTGEKKVNGKDAWTVDLTGTINVSFDSSKTGSADPSGALGKTHVIVVGTTTLQGTGSVDKVTGKTLTLESNGMLQSKISLEPGDTTATTSGTISTSVRLQG